MSLKSLCCPTEALSGSAKMRAAQTTAMQKPVRSLIVRKRNSALPKVGRSFRSRLQGQEQIAKSCLLRNIGRCVYLGCIYLTCANNHDPRQISDYTIIYACGEMLQIILASDPLGICTLKACGPAPPFPSFPRLKHHQSSELWGNTEINKLLVEIRGMC